MNQPAKSASPLISAIVPVFQNEGSLRVLYERIKTSLEPLSPDFEIVFVEDCGGDRSWDVIRELAKNDPRVSGIRFSRNFGQHFGITAGIDHCRGHYAVIMDADLQDPPEEIPALYRKALEGFDVVVAKRIIRKDSLPRRLASRFFAWAFTWLSHMPYDFRVGNFRLISHRVIINFRRMRESLRFFPGLIEWMGFPTAAINIVHEERPQGKSAYSLKKLLKLTGDAIIAYSDKPLRISVVTGFVMSVLAFLLGAILIYKKLVQDIGIQGWTSLIVSIFFLGGIIIFLLGILGIYLIRTFDETKKRPLYIIREVVGGQLEEKMINDGAAGNTE